MSKGGLKPPQSPPSLRPCWLVIGESLASLHYCCFIASNLCGFESGLPTVFRIVSTRRGLHYRCFIARLRGFESKLYACTGRGERGELSTGASWITGHFSKSIKESLTIAGQFYTDSYFRPSTKNLTLFINACLINSTFSVFSI